MEIDETISKAAQTMTLIATDLAEATEAAYQVKGPTLRHRALAAYLAECLKLARDLENKLLLIAE